MKMQLETDVVMKWLLDQCSESEKRNGITAFTEKAFVADIDVKNMEKLRKDFETFLNTKENIGHKVLVVTVPLLIPIIEGLTSE